MLRQRRVGRRSKRRLGTKHYRSHATALNIRLMPLADTRRASRAIAAVLLALLVWVVYSIFNSDSFYVYSARVEGNVTVTPEQVFGASQLEGLNIFWVDPEQAAQLVMERLPTIKSAQVTAQLPARVVISVEERVPYLVWRTGDKEWWVDEEGVAYAPGSGQPQGLVVVDNDARPLRAGQHLDAQVIPAVRALRYWLPKISQAFYSEATGIGFHTSEGWPVYLGDGTDMEAKLRIVKALYDQFKAQNTRPDAIDARYVGGPAYK